MPEKYKVLEAFSYGDELSAARSLTEKVNEHMNDGWIPQGGIVVGFNSTARQSYWYAMQAMVRDHLYKRPLKDHAKLANDQNFFEEGLL